MASTPQLNVEIGARIKGLQKGLRDAERELRQSTAKMGQLGVNLTQAISLPLAVFGGAAIVAAGEIESLGLAMESTFKNSGRTVAESTAEVEKLRVAALAPGLDFPQAVKASIRLQSVGLTAETARGTIQELANAIASTGGTAQNLESVTVQFGQMISKGKVLSQDLRIVQENLPIISDLMLKAFGTSNAENIQKLGISGKEFVTKITAEMGKLNRVQGGISNAIVNAGSAIKQFLAGIGIEINKVFNIGELSDRFAASLAGIVEWFKNLDASTKQAIVKFALLAAAIGPAIKIMAVLIQTVFALGKAFTFLQIQGLRARVLGLVDSFRALNTVMKANVIGIAILAVLALAAAYNILKTDMSGAAQAQRAVEAQHKAGAAAAAEERGKTEVLIDVLNDENASRQEKAAALTKLQSISPKYFAGLKIENGLVVGLKESYDSYIENIYRAAEAKKVESQLIEAFSKRDELAKKRAAAANAPDFVSGAGSGKKFILNKLDPQIKANDELIESLKAVGRANVDLSAATDTSTESTKEFTAATGGANKKLETLKEVLSDIANERSRQELLGASDVEEEAQVIESGLKKLLDNGFTPTSKAVQDLKNELKGLFSGQKIENFAPLAASPIATSVTSEAGPAAGPQEVDLSKVERFLSYSQQLGEVNTALQEGVMGFNDAFAKTAALVGEQGTLMEQVFLSVGQAISQAAASGATSFKQLAGAAVGAAAKVVRANIQMGVSSAVAKALQAVPFPFNTVAALVAGGLAAALFTKLIGSIGVKGFANGTNYAPGGLALVGERGRELVNLPRGSQVLGSPKTNDLLSGLGGQNISLSGEFRVKGTDLVLALERTNAKNLRQF